MTSPLTVLGVVKLVEDTFGVDVVRAATTFVSTITDTTEQPRTDGPDTEPAPAPAPGEPRPADNGRVTRPGGRRLPGTGVWHETTDPLTRPTTPRPAGPAAGPDTGSQVAAGDLTRGHLAHRVRVRGERGEVTGQLLAIAHRLDGASELTVTAPVGGTLTVSVDADTRITFTSAAHDG